MTAQHDFPPFVASLSFSANVLISGQRERFSALENRLTIDCDLVQTIQCDQSPDSAIAAQITEFINTHLKSASKMAGLDSFLILTQIPEQSCVWKNSELLFLLNHSDVGIRLIFSVPNLNSVPQDFTLKFKYLFYLGNKQPAGQSESYDFLDRLGWGVHRLPSAREHQEIVDQTCVDHTCLVFDLHADDTVYQWFNAENDACCDEPLTVPTAPTAPTAQLKLSRQNIIAFNLGSCAITSTRLIRDLENVKLRCDCGGDGLFLKAGTEGTVVSIHNNQSGSQIGVTLEISCNGKSEIIDLPIDAIDAIDVEK